MKTLKCLATGLVAAFILSVPALADPELAPPGSKVIVTPSSAGFTQVPVRYQAPVNNPVPSYDPYSYYYYYGLPSGSGSSAPGPQTVIDPSGYPVLRTYDTYVSPAEARWRRR